jgi:alkylation response protein AidB-like acyl-CoA dehydrogenase
MTTPAVSTHAPAAKSRNGAGARPILKLDSPELKALLDELAAGASEREAKRIAPHAQIRQIADAGLGRLRISVAEGGAGVSLRELFQFLIRLGEADSNLVHILRVHYWFVEAQLQRAVTDPRRSRNLALINQGHIFGNGFSEQSQRAVGLYFDTTIAPDPSGKGYRLNGKKYYSTGSLFSTYTAIFASTPAGNVAAAIIPIDREGLKLEDDWDGFGQRLTGTGSTILDNVFVANDEFD